VAALSHWLHKTFAWLRLSSSLILAAVPRQELLSAHKVSLAVQIHFIKGDLKLILLPPSKGVLVLLAALDDDEVPVGDADEPVHGDEAPDPRTGAIFTPISDSSACPGRSVNLSLTFVLSETSSSSLMLVPVFITSS
jgi:hypothetical protein